MDEETTQLLEGLAKGDQLAIQEIWNRYNEPLMRLARRKLGEASRRAADEEDIALSAFHSFCRGAAAGRFPQLDDRQDLWKLMVTITARKAAAQLRRSHRQKRGGGAVRGESAFLYADSTSSHPTPGIDRVEGDERTPELEVMFTEECARLLDQLEDESLRKIALYKLEGYSNDEIASLLSCAPRTIERKLARIRDLWQGH